MCWADQSQKQGSESSERSTPQHRSCVSGSGRCACHREALPRAASVCGPVLPSEAQACTIERLADRGQSTASPRSRTPTPTTCRTLDVSLSGGSRRRDAAPGRSGGTGRGPCLPPRPHRARRAPPIMHRLHLAPRLPVLGPARRGSTAPAAEAVRGPGRSHGPA